MKVQLSRYCTTTSNPAVVGTIFFKLTLTLAGITLSEVSLKHSQPDLTHSEADFTHSRCLASHILTPTFHILRPASHILSQTSHILGPTSHILRPKSHILGPRSGPICPHSASRLVSFTNPLASRIDAGNLSTSRLAVQICTLSCTLTATGQWSAQPLGIWAIGATILYYKNATQNQHFENKEPC